MTTYDMIPTERVKYGVVLNDLDADLLLPCHLGGWELRWATVEEIAEFQPGINSYARSHFGQPASQELAITPQGSGYLYTCITDSTQWRYSIVQPANPSAMLGARLAEALRLSVADLRVEHWVGQRPPGSDGPQWTPGGSPGQCVQFFGEFRRFLPAKPDLSELQAVTKLRQEFDDAKYPSITRTVALFRELDSVPEHSRTKLLGYFGVLEGVLSHAPSPQDPVDSVTRQLKRNLILLDNRAPAGENLGVSEFEGAKDSSQVIAKLYSYRSAIAHGGDGTGDLQWFEDRRPVRWQGDPPRLWLHYFMRLLVKRVLVAALREPQLVHDLRAA